MIQPRFTPVFAPQIAQYCAEEWCQCIHIFAQGDFDCIDGGRQDVIKNIEVDGDVEASDDDQQLEKDWCIEPRCSSLSCSTLTQSCPGRRTMSTDVAPPHSSLVATVCRRGCTIPMMVSRDSPVDFQSHSSNDFHHVVCNTEQHLALRLRTSTVSIPNNSGTGRIGGNCRHS